MQHRRSNTRELRDYNPKLCFLTFPSEMLANDAIPMPSQHMTETLKPFALEDRSGNSMDVPTGRASLLCFLKDDCPTCQIALPIIDAFHRAYGEQIDIIAVDQSDPAGGGVYAGDRTDIAILDDSACKTAFDYDIETVPTLIISDPGGTVGNTVAGFVKEEWHALSQRLAEVSGESAADINWDDLPDWRPGCGSKSLDPAINDRLRAEAEGSPIRSRKIEVAKSDDVFEFMFDQGFSDGLPLVPPTAERVMRMLDGTSRDAQSIVALMPPNMGEVTVEKVAVNAVMAGCKPEYMPVIIACVEAVCTDEFNIHGVMATTMGASPVIIVNGPIRHKLGMNMTLGALGHGNRANATIGRALRLIIRNVGGSKPGGTDRSTLGNPMKFTMCFAEWEERNPWPPLHVERGFDAEDSVVTVFAMTSGPVLIVDQESRDPDQLGGSLGMGLEGVFLPKMHLAPVDALLVVCPEHVDTLMQEEYSKERLRKRIQEATSTPMRNMMADDRSGAGLKPAQVAKLSEEQLDAPAPKFRNEDYIHIVVAGSDAGKFSAAFHGWATGEIGSASVSRKIGE